MTPADREVLARTGSRHEVKLTTITGYVVFGRCVQLDARSIHFLLRGERRTTRLHVGTIVTVEVIA